MRIYENTRVADWFIKELRRRMFERQDRTGPWHASELFQCLRKSLLNRTKPVPYNRKAIVRFAVGFALQEWFFGPENEGEEIWGIIFSPDQIIQGHVFEFKSTAKSKEKKNGERFDVTEQKQWIDRTRSYCAAFGKHIAHIVVYFLFQRDIAVYTLEFTDKDLEEAKKDIERRKAVLDEFKAREELPGIEYRYGDWECNYCPYALEYCLQELRASGAKIDVEV